MTYQPPPGEGQPDPAAGQPAYNPPQPPPPGYNPPQPPPQPPPPAYNPPTPPPAYDPAAAPPAYNPPPAGAMPPPAPGAMPPPAPGAMPPSAPGAMPPASQQPWNAPPTGAAYPTQSAGFDAKSVDPMDWAIVAMGPLAFIFSLFSFYTAKVSVAGFSESAHENGWHGFFGWFGAFVALVASAVLALSLFAPQIKLPVPARLAALGGFALALICYLLAWFITPGVSNVPSELHVDFGRGIGFYAGLLFVVIGLVLSFLRFQKQGGKLPGRR